MKLMTPTDSCHDYSEYGIKYNSFLAVSKQAFNKEEEWSAVQKLYNLWATYGITISSSFPHLAQISSLQAHGRQIIW